MDDERHRDTAESAPGAPGSAGSDLSAQLSRLLEELAEAPPASLEEAWDRGLRAGDEVGRFRLVRELGRGGFGVVFEAEDRELGRSVAFKAIRAGNQGAARSHEWLRREAEAVGRLHHPAIVTLHDIGQGPSGPYLIFELLRGETLTERTRGGPLPFEAAVRVALEIARALAHAHQAGVVHRDLKPANVFLLADGRVKVLDFGLAHLFGRGTPASAGTPAFMAPEQWRGEPGDERVDLFALGCLLHLMLSGDLPYRVTWKGTEALHAAAAPPLEVAGLPAALRRLVARCLDPDPARRPPSAAGAVRELEAVSGAVSARRHRLALGAGAAAVALLTAGTLWVFENFTTSSGEPQVVAVADVANETGDRSLDGLSGLLITSLEQSRRLHVLSRTRMLDLARQGAGREATRIDEVVGQEIAKQARARALLLASVHRFESVYALELRALQPGGQDYLFTLQEKAQGRDGIPAAIDRLSEAVRRRLSERSGDLRRASVRVGQSVTGSLDAYGHYYRGLECTDHKDDAGGWNAAPTSCTADFRRAVALDPSFSLAWYQLAMLLPAAGAPAAEVDRATRAALDHVERAPPKEQALIRAWEADRAGRPDEALEAYHAVLARFPDDKRTLELAAELEIRRARFADAVPWLEKLLFLDPTHESATDELVLALGVLGRREDLAARVRQWEAVPLVPAVAHALVRARVWLGDVAGALGAARRAIAAGGGPLAQDDLVGALQAAGDYREVEQVLRARARAGPLTSYMALQRVAAAAAQGRLSEARRLLLAWERAEVSAGSASNAADVRTMWACGFGTPDETLAAAQEAARLDPEDVLAVYVAWAGAVQGAERLGAALPAGSEARRKLDAVIAWRRGQLEEARALASRLEESDPYAQSPGAGPFPSLLSAEVCAAQGDAACTAAAVGRFHALWPRGFWRSWAWPRSLQLLAAAEERLGRRAEARATLDRLLALQAGADPASSLHEESRRLRSRLQ